MAFDSLMLLSTDTEAARGWKTAEVRFTEALADIETVVRHLNEITSYSRVNLERQVKNLELRHASVVVPEEYSKFPIHMVSKPQNLDFYGRHDELQRIDNYLNPKDVDNILRTYSKCTFISIEKSVTLSPRKEKRAELEVHHLHHLSP